MRLLFIVVVALIVYGSLYPWEFDWDVASPRIVTGLRYASWSDRALNVLVYVPLGVTAFLGAPRRARLAQRLLAPVLIGFCLSALLEGLQLYQPRRVTSLIDILCNTAGAAVGALAAHAVRGVRARDALLLAAGWGVWLVSPWLPAGGAAGHIATGAVWYVSGCLLRACGVPARLAAAVLALAALRVPPGAAGAVAGTIVFAVLPRRWGSRPEAGWVLLGVVAWSGLMPEAGETALRPFRWMPFAGLLESDWGIALRVLAAKIVLYGSSLWALSRAWWGLAGAAAMVAAILASIEAAQTRLPGRTPESTDPLLALLLAGILAILRNRSAPGGTDDSPPDSSCPPQTAGR